MVKQTVEQKYIIEQAMKDAQKPKELVRRVLKTDEQNEIVNTFSKMENALQESLQAVRQLQANNQTDSNLQLISARFTNVIQLLNEIHLANPEGMFRLSKGEQQQLKQLDYQINQAKGTLQVLKQSL